MKENDGSDLHLVAGQPPRFRAKGKIQIIPGHDVLSNDDLRAMIGEAHAAPDLEPLGPVPVVPVPLDGPLPTEMG